MKKVLFTCILFGFIVFTPNVIQIINYQICTHAYYEMDIDNSKDVFLEDDEIGFLLGKLDKLGDYGKASLLKNNILERCAESYFTKGNELRAYQILKEIGYDAESNEIMSEILSISPQMDLICAAEGDEVVFGKYDLDGELDNGEEPLRWYVIKSENNRKLLFSKYYWEIMPYCDNYNMEYGCVSIVSHWLENENLYDFVFSPWEKELLLEQQLSDTSNDKYGTNLLGWTAKLYLLSLEDYKMVPSQFRCGVVPEKLKKDPQNLSKGYWLRTPGVDYDGTCYVDKDGVVQLLGDDNKIPYYIRPAVWIKINNEED